MTSNWTASAWKGKSVTIAGLGTFGGQLAAARFFAALGARVSVTDRKPRESLDAGLRSLDGLPVRLRLGGHDMEDFASADLVVASPAIPETSDYLTAAASAGVPITHEMDIFFQLCRAPIVAVTGSNGKSTTTALLAHILTRHFAGTTGARSRVRLGGNIGHSLLLEIERIDPCDLVVLELSSFQLEDLGELGLSPHGAVVTNLTPNHLDRHGTFDNYANAKRQITLHQKPGDFLVLNADDPNLAGWDNTRAGVVYFGKTGPEMRNGVYFSGRSLVSLIDGVRSETVISSGWKLMGAHNVANLAAACAAAGRLGVPLDAAVAAAEDFEPLAHRLELVAEARGVSFYNDSIATTPESVEVALDSFHRPVILIAGGYDKGLDLSAFAARAARSIKALVAIGKTGPAIAAAALSARPDLTVVRPADFRAAVNVAFTLASPGDVVILSPACASYDMFENFQQRGDLFRSFAREIAAKSVEPSK